MTLIQGDCLVESEQIETGSVDLILTDPPYGTVKGLDIDGWNNQSTHWDTAIDPKELFNVADRILRKNGRLILFSQEPYTNNLLSNTIPNLPLSYKAIWLKDNAANALGCNKAMTNYYEEITIYQKQNPVHDSEFTNPLRPYFQTMREYIKATTGEINKTLNNQMSSHYFTKGAQFTIPVEKDYNKLINVYHIDKMDGFMTLEEVKEIHEPFTNSMRNKANQKYPSTFNLRPGYKSKPNVLSYNKPVGGLHPTQKPTALLEDLIYTFTNKGNLVVDLTMGSGSTGVACKNTGRDFIGIELDKGYFEIAKKRINETTSLFNHDS